MPITATPISPNPEATIARRVTASPRISAARNSAMIGAMKDNAIPTAIGIRTSPQKKLSAMPQVTADRAA